MRRESLNTFFAAYRPFLGFKKESFDQTIKRINGFYAKDPSLYHLALHQQPNGEENNERLEFLGDAVLDVVIAEILYVKFPDRGEGQLTHMKSELVKASSLNRLASAVGITPLIITNLSVGELSESKVPGSALEAWVGAIYLDRGIQAAKRFIEKTIIGPHVDWSTIESQNTDYKSQVLQWAQRKNVALKTQFEQAQYKGGFGFLAKMQVNEHTSEGLGRSKKIAEQKAAQKLLEKIK